MIDAVTKKKIDKIKPNNHHKIRVGNVAKIHTLSTSDTRNLGGKTDLLLKIKHTVFEA